MSQGMANSRCIWVSSLDCWFPILGQKDLAKILFIVSSQHRKKEDKNWLPQKKKETVMVGITMQVRDFLYNLHQFNVTWSTAFLQYNGKCLSWHLNFFNHAEMYIVTLKLKLKYTYILSFLGKLKNA